MAYELPDGRLKIGDFHDLKVQLALAGFVLMAVLHYWNVRGGITTTVRACYPPVQMIDTPTPRV